MYRKYSLRISLTIFPVCALLSMAAESAGAQDFDKYYLGLGIGSADYSGRYETITFTDSPPTIKAYGGYRFREQWALEISYTRFRKAQSGTIPGSGTQLIQLTDGFESTSISAVRQFSLSDAFRWKTDLSLFGMVGVNSSKTEAGRLVVSTSEYSKSKRDESGVTASLGVLHGRRNFAVRGYLQWLDVFDNSALTTFGVSAEFGF